MNNNVEHRSLGRRGVPSIRISIARLSFRLILRRMRQRTLVLENLSKIAAVNPPPHPGQWMK
jgi:hypothetical protein